MRRRLRIGWVALLLIAGCSSNIETTETADPTSSENLNGVAPTAWDVRPLLPGMEAPAFTVKDADNVDFSFTGAERDRPAILTFYRGGWCPYCSRQLSELRELDTTFNELGYELLFLSADRPAHLSEGELDTEASYRLLSDSTLSVSKAFGIAFRMEDATVERYRSRDLDLAERSGSDHRLLPAPSVFIVGSDGIIKFQYTNPDYRVRVPGSVVLEAARAYADESV